MMDDRLIGILRVPDPAGVSASQAEWDALFQDIGSRLPQDLIDFNRIYGLGSINDDIDIGAPCSVPRFDLRRLAAWATRSIDSYHGIGSAMDFEAFPDPGGLLPWASSGAGDCFHWLTQGTPDQWTVVVEPEARLPSMFIRYDMNMSTFLAELISGQIDDDFGREVRIHNPRFVPFLEPKG